MIETFFLLKKSKKQNLSFFLLFFLCFLGQTKSLYPAAQAQAVPQPLGQPANAAAQNFAQAAVAAAVDQAVHEGWRYYINQTCRGCKQSWTWAKENKEGFKSAGMITFTAALIAATAPVSAPVAILVGFSVEGARRFLRNDTPAQQQLPQAQVQAQAVPADIHNNNHIPELVVREVNEITFDLRRMDNDFHQFRQETIANFTDVRNNLSQVRQDVHGLGQRVDSIETNQQRIDRENQQLRIILQAAIAQQRRGRGALPPAGNHVIVEPFDDEDEQIIVPRQQARLAARGQRQVEVIDLENED